MKIELIAVLVTQTFSVDHLDLLLQALNCIQEDVVVKEELAVRKMFVKKKNLVDISCVFFGAEVSIVRIKVSTKSLLLVLSRSKYPFKKKTFVLGAKS